METWQQLNTAGAGATGAGAPQPSSPRHMVLPPPADEPTRPEQIVPVPETGLVDVLLCGHRQTLTLFNHFTLAVARGNTHTMELLTGALAVDVRLHSQAVLDVLYPLLQQRYHAEGAQQAAAVQAQLQAVERDLLEMLTFRRERDWRALADRTNLTHQHFAAHVHDVEVGLLPRLAADLKQDELASLALLFHQAKQTASLAPQTGVDAFDAAAKIGPEAAGVLRGPLVAGEYQPHRHAHVGAAQMGAGHVGAGHVGAGTSGRQPGIQFVSDSQTQQAERVSVAKPDRIVTPSQQVFVGEEP